MISKDKINGLILNYFIQEGCQEAAVSFARDIGIDLNDAEVPSDTPSIRHPHSQGNNTIKQRTEIKLLILKGSIAEAIHQISANFPMVLDKNNLLHFKLLRLNLIEMIREHKLGSGAEQTPSETSSKGNGSSKNGAAENGTSGANDKERAFLQHILSFVRENLINKVSQSSTLLKELEITMSLLCFKFEPSLDVSEQRDLPQQLRSLFDLSLRTQCYRLVNSAILNLHEQPEEVYTGPQYPEIEFNMNGEIDEDEIIDEDMDFEVEYSSGLPTTTTTSSEQAASSATSVQSSTEPTSRLERIIQLYTLTEQRLIDLHVVREPHSGVLIQ